MLPATDEWRVALLDVENLLVAWQGRVSHPFASCLSHCTDDGRVALLDVENLIESYFTLVDSTEQRLLALGKQEHRSIGA